MKQPEKGKFLLIDTEAVMCDESWIDISLFKGGKAGNMHWIRSPYIHIFYILFHPDISIQASLNGFLHFPEEPLVIFKHAWSWSAVVFTYFERVITILIEIVWPSEQVFPVQTHLSQNNKNTKHLTSVLYYGLFGASASSKVFLPE